MSPAYATLDSENIFHSIHPTVYMPDDVDCASLIFDYKPRRSNDIARTPLEGKTLFIDALSGRTVSFEEARHLTDGVAKVLKERFQLGWDDVLALYAPSKFIHYACSSCITHFRSDDIMYGPVCWGVHRLGAIVSSANPSYCMPSV
jgi:4-coumarate--CoA ligase